MWKFTQLPCLGAAMFSGSVALHRKSRSTGFQGRLYDILTGKARKRRHTEFLAMLAHDIRNPLSVISGYADVLIERARDRGDDEEEVLLQRLQDHLLTVHALVTDYLEFSKLEAGYVTLKKTPVSLDNLLGRVVRQYETEAQHRHVGLGLRFQEDLPRVEGDILALERVFANLVFNALKFTPASGTVTVSAVRQGETVVVTVTDTGPGIMLEEIGTIFEKYHKGKASEERGGVGLGLFIAKTLVEAHGGSMAVGNAPGAGACFFVSLPVAKSGTDLRNAHPAGPAQESLLDTNEPTLA